MSTERSSTQSPPSTLVPSQRHSPIGAEGSDDDDNVEEEELAANDDNDNDAWDSWGDPEEAEKVSTSPIDPQMSKPTPIEPTVMSKPQSDIASGGAKKFVDADLSMMDIKVRVLPDGGNIDVHFKASTQSRSRCFVLYSYGSSGYQLGCTVAALPAHGHRPMEHVGYAQQNITNE